MKLSKKVVLVTTAVLGELAIGGGLAVGSMNQAANANSKYPQLDNANWKKVETHQHDNPSRYTNYKGEGLVDYGNSERAWADNTYFFTAIEQPYSQVSHENASKENIKNDHNVYSQMRGSYLSTIINKGKSVNMHNVNELYRPYLTTKNNYYRQSGKQFAYVYTKPVKAFVTNHFTKGTMKYELPAGTTVVTNKVYNDHGHYSIKSQSHVLTYEDIYTTTNKKFVKRFAMTNDPHKLPADIKYANTHPYLIKAQKQYDAKYKANSQLK